MKIKGWLVQLFLGVIVANCCQAQIPPPNDNFSNRIVLSGTDVTFSGTLAGSTLEDPRETETYNFFGITPATHSVWWSWTAPATTVLNLQILSSSPYNAENDFRAAYAVYTATNGSTAPDGLELPALGFRFISFFLSPQTLSIPVTAGEEYQIQLIGTASVAYTSRLIATNRPVIVQQPRSRTVSSNESAVFYVMAAGFSQSSFAFQWLLNGTNLDGEIAPELALTNITAASAGAYSVWVSNSAGITVSEPAILAVSQSNAQVTLTAIGVLSNKFGFSLTGENARSYRIEASTDLVNWVPHREFLKEPYFVNGIQVYLTSVVFTTNSPLVLTVTNDSVGKFYRASPFVPSPTVVDLCANHQQQIRVAKRLWQRDYGTSPIASPSLSDLMPYLPGHQAPFCPLDFLQSFSSSYAIYNLSTEPACRIIPLVHKLEEPQ